eukprot:Pgem_evm1s5575
MINEIIYYVISTIEYAIRKNENTWENGLPDSSVVKSKLPDRVGRGFDSRSVIYFPTHRRGLDGYGVVIEYAIRKNENTWENGLPDSSV